MFNSKKIHDPISLFISTFNHGIKARKKYMFLPYNRLILKIIQILYEKGYIISYKVYSSMDTRRLLSHICIWFKRYQNKELTSTIKSYYKPSYKRHKTYQQLHNIKQKQRCELLLTTPSGFKWLNECLHLKIGGILLFEIT